MLDEILLNKYRLEEQLQDTPAALIYRGIELESNLAVIVTVFKEELVSPREFQSRLGEVADKLNRLDLPNVVHILDYGEHQNQAIVVQKLIKGQALSEMFTEGTSLQVHLVLDIAQQLGEYLRALHQAGITHGSLDSQSVILAADGYVKVLNAGLANGLNAAELIASKKMEVQPLYAPEVRSGGELTPRSDFYALGAILYEAFTGEALELNPKSPYPGSQRTGLPPELDELIGKCLQADPSRRVQSAVEFLNGIEEVHRGMEASVKGMSQGVEDALVGHTLGAYQLVERLGQGGMATVYKAYEPALDRYVAIKVLRKYFAQDPEFIQRFRREAKAIAKLNHPNIVPIYNFGEQGDITYIVMRYVEGGTLKQARGYVFEPERAVHLLLPIARALAYAHQRGIVHRDIKPSNVLLSEGDWPMLTDYGLAKMVESTTQLTGTGVGMGTPMYMSPEQGQGVALDHRTDIYSLGIMFYEMLTGDVPFQADTPMAIVIKHISSPMPMPRQVNPHIPEVLERIILKATAKSPADRYQTAEELVAALEHSLSVLKSTIRDKSKRGGISPQKLDDLYRQALAAMKVRRWETARKFLEQVQGEQPGYRETEQLLGRITAEIGEGEILSERKRAPWLRKVPVWGWALGGLAIMAILVGVIGGNAGLFRRTETPTMAPTSQAVQESQDFEYWREIGWSQYQQDDYAAAKEAFDRAIELNPEDCSAWWGRALVYREQGDAQTAIQQLGRAIELNPEGGGLYIDRGWLYFDVGDTEMAFSDFNMAIAVEPDVPHNYFQRGHAYRLLGKVDEARADFERYLEITNGDPSADWHAEVTQWLAENPRTIPGCVDPPPGLVSWWTGDGHTEDVVGGNQATLLNGAGYAEGMVGQAFAFPSPSLDGEDALVDAFETPSLDDLKELTIETWVMLASGPAFRIERFVTIRVEGADIPKAVLRIDGGPGFRGNLHFYMGIDNELQHIWVEDVPETGNFHHTAGSYDGSVMRLYLDGREVGSLPITGEVASGVSFVGMSSAGEPLDGLLDEVSIYNRALTATEILAIYEAGSAGKCKP